MTRLHVFDLDGTLLTGSACLELCRHLGQLDAVLEIEDAWGRGEVGHVEFYEILLKMWEGLTESDIDEVFTCTPWIDGVQEVMADIAARGEHSAVISLSPQFFVDRLLDWGVGSAHGARVYVGAPLVADDVLTPESKVLLVEELMNRYDVVSRDCVAYGDSSSDVPLFEVLDNTVAVNASESLVALAAAHYEGPDLMVAYAEGRRLLDRCGVP